MSFYNTANLRDDVLAEARATARSQEEAILRYLDIMSGCVYDFTPSEIWRDLFRYRVPITSVRRAITDLTKEGRLWKTDRQRPGQFGKPEYVWQKKPANGQTEMF